MYKIVYCLSCRKYHVADSPGYKICNVEGILNETEITLPIVYKGHNITFQERHQVWITKDFRNQGWTRNHKKLTYAKRYISNNLTT